MAYEVNFDGIVGPTHNYSGLSYGNIASQSNQYLISNPREAALQGLEKMKYLSDLGIKQAVLPPHERPFLPLLNNLGFDGNQSETIKKASKEFPEVFLTASSAAAMWTANAATVTPSSDSNDNKVHITAANLTSKLHRSIETPVTERILRKIFNGFSFIHHTPLPGHSLFADEGAANHTRFCKTYEETGVHLFVYGRGGKSGNQLPKTYPARQSYDASLAIMRLHQLHSENTVFVQQHPDAIDAGAFHNDVVSVGNMNVFLFHEKAFVDRDRVLEEIARKVLKTCKAPMFFLEVKNEIISLKDAISTYLFNSQLVSLPDHSMALIAPIECQENQTVHRYLNEMISKQKTSIKHLHFLNLRQSMQNGGGPACLRLRVVLNEEELKNIHQPILFTDTLYLKLINWIKTHYRDTLHPKELSDPHLLQEVYIALEELTKILDLGPIYDFQKR